ncbi:hypothetical protein AUG19_00110 [archaeon 13_1_20CM_2_54_9]|nr:MAG: hypothetical protein AUG19_00110 [archaeon 13_1_20CM_2_54_9]
MVFSSRRIRLKTCITLLLAGLSPLILPTPAHAFSNILTVDPNQATAPVNSTITISVSVQDFQPFNGADISLQYDSTPGVLNAVSADLENSIMLAGSFPPLVVVDCVNSPVCPGEVHIAAAILGAFTSAPSGPLFNIHFKVVGSGTTALHIFKDDIASVNVLVPHITVDGSFSSAPTPPSPDFFIQAASFVMMAQGINFSTTIPVTLTSANGYSGTLNLNASISTTLPNPPVVQLNPATATLQPDHDTTVLLTISITGKTKPEHYLATITATDGVTTHSIPIDVQILAYFVGGVRATITLDPSTVQSSSNRRYLTALIELPFPYSLSQIILSTITLNYQAGLVTRPSARIGDRNQNGVPDLAVRFLLPDVIATLHGPGTYNVIITGVITGAPAPEFYGFAQLVLT